MSGENPLNPAEFLTEQDQMRAEASPGVEEGIVTLGEEQIKEDDGFEFGADDDETQKAA